MVINFEKIGPDPPPPTEKSEDSLKDDVNSRDSDFSSELPNINDRTQLPSSQPLNTSWYNCRKMIYVPRITPQKGYPLGL